MHTRTHSSRFEFAGTRTDIQPNTLCTALMVYSKRPGRPVRQVHCTLSHQRHGWAHTGCLQGRHDARSRGTQRVDMPTTQTDASRHTQSSHGHACTDDTRGRDPHAHDAGGAYKRETRHQQRHVPSGHSADAPLLLTEPLNLTFWPRVSKISPVPGGRSTTR
jgi:hypothetical protein